MNPDQPSREQIEPRITALLLGELPADEAALLRYTIAQDPALQKLQDELKAALTLVREAEKNLANGPENAAEPLKLSGERRTQLLAHFKTPRPQVPRDPLFWLKRIKAPSLVPVLVLVAFIALVAALFLPALSKAKYHSRGTYGTENTLSGLFSRNAPAPAASAPAAKPTPAPSLAYRTWSGDNQNRLSASPNPATEDDLRSLNQPPAKNAPRIVTLSSQPQIAPPPAALPVQIALPWSGPSAGAAAPDSQTAVGYVSTLASAEPVPLMAPPPVATAPAPTIRPAPGVDQFTLNGNETPAVDKMMRREHVEKQWKVPSTGVESYSGALKPAISGGDIELPAENQIIAGQSSPSLAFNAGTLTPAADGRVITRLPDFDTDRHSLALTEPSSPQPVSAPGAAGVAGNGADRTANAGTVRTRGMGGSAGNKVNHNVARKSAKTGAPQLADIPMVGDQFQSSGGASTPATMADASAPPASATALGFQWNLGQDQDGQKQAANHAELMGQSGRSAGGLAGNYSFSSATAGVPATSADSFSSSTRPALVVQQMQRVNQQSAEPEKAYNEDLAQLRALNAIPKTHKAELEGKLAQIAPDSTLENLVKRRDEAARNATTLKNANPSDRDAIARAQSSVNQLDEQIDHRVDGVMAGLESNVQATKTAQEGMTAAVAAANSGAASAQTLALNDAKRDLEQKTEMRKLMLAKVEEEKLDAELPKSSMVQITDPAEPNRNQTFWQRLTGQYESKARLRTEKDVSDIPGMSTSGSTIVGFDPYFVQTTYELMQSEAVLGKVVDRLNLQSASAKENQGQALTRPAAIARLKQQLDLHAVPNTEFLEIGVRDSDPQQAADIANAVAAAYRESRVESRRALTTNGVAVLENQIARQSDEIRQAQEKVDRLAKAGAAEPAAAKHTDQADRPLRKPAPNTPLPQPEILASSNAFSTFAMNVSDVSFKFAAASLQNGQLPDTASIRSEEFINAFDYRDPEAAPGQPMAFLSERARYPFAHNRDLLRFSVKAAAAGRQSGRALNLVLLLDTSGSMERADRVKIIREALRVLAAQFQSQDTVSVVTFARTARLWADGIPGRQAGATLDKVGGITPEGGTNLEEAMRLAYETARRHYLPGGINRVVLLTDGAANLGNADPAALQAKVEAQRTQGIALDCFGIGWEDFNDDLLEQLSSHGDGRYAFLNSPEDAARDFAAKLAGALQVAAADLKVQVEFNPRRVIAYRQIGYARHQLTQEQFRDNSVAAGEIAAQEAGNALYTIETNPRGDGPIATVRVRYRVPGTRDYREQSWEVPYTGTAPALAQASPALRLAAAAGAFSEWLAASPYAQEVTPDALLKTLNGVPEIYAADDRPKQLVTMIREARSLEGK